MQRENVIASAMDERLQLLCLVTRGSCALGLVASSRCRPLRAPAYWLGCGPRVAGERRGAAVGRGDGGRDGARWCGLRV